MALPRLIRLDNCPVENEKFTEEFRVWITNQVDIINQDLERLDGLLQSINQRLINGGL